MKQEGSGNAKDFGYRKERYLTPERAELAVPRAPETPELALPSAPETVEEAPPMGRVEAEFKSIEVRIPPPGPTVRDQSQR